MSIPIRQGVASSVRSCHASSCTIRAAAVLFASGTYRLTNLAPSQLLSPALPLCSSGCSAARRAGFPLHAPVGGGGGGGLLYATQCHCRRPPSLTGGLASHLRVLRRPRQSRAACFDVACPVYATPSEYNNETRPATSCLEIKEIFPAAPSAPYYLKFSASAPVEKIWCEMEPVVCEFKLWGAGGGGEKGLVGGFHAGSGGFTRGQFKMSIGQEVTVKVGRGGRSADSTDTCVEVMYGDGNVCSETGGAGGGGYAGSSLGLKSLQRQKF